MSKEDAKRFHDRLNEDESLRDQFKAAWGEIQKLAAKHGYHFDHGEYFDVVHEETGMSKVGKSDHDDHPDTCIVFLSETPRY